MPALLTTPPDRGEYAHVLFRGDRYLLDHSIAMITYTGTYDSRWIPWVGRDPRTDPLLCPAGKSVHMLFVRTPEERDYAKMRGWLDITDDWFRYIDQGAADAQDAAKVLASLEAPSTAATVAKATGLTPERAGAVLSALSEAGAVSRRGTGAVIVWSRAEAATADQPAA